MSLIRGVIHRSLYAPMHAYGYTTEENGQPFPQQPFAPYEYPGKRGLHQGLTPHDGMPIGSMACRWSQLLWAHWCNGQVMHTRHSETLQPSESFLPSAVMFSEPWWGDLEVPRTYEYLKTQPQTGQLRKQNITEVIWLGLERQPQPLSLYDKSILNRKHT